MPLIKPLTLGDDFGLPGFLGDVGASAANAINLSSRLGGAVPRFGATVGGGALSGFGHSLGGLGTGVSKMGFGGGVEKMGFGGGDWNQKIGFGGDAGGNPFNQKFGAKDFMVGGGPMGQPGAMGAVGGAATMVGGEWAKLDEHNNEINTAAAKFGVPANLLKSMINRESSGNWGAGYDQSYGGFRNDDILPFVGIFRNTADSWGLNYDAMIGNKQAQVDGMATIMKGLSDQYGGFENAVKVYFGGEGALNGGTFVDELGMDSNTYGQKAIDGWKQLDAKSGGGGYSSGPGAPQTQGGYWGGNATGNNVVEIAKSYVGAQYVWGSIPNAGDDPWSTGWDCSGFTRWLDQKYGNGQLPAGSHYQYQYAADTNQLKRDTGQLQAGDLVFFDTGLRGGGGANLNGASHVGVYIGNGQMLHAANPESGTIISDFNAYTQMYPYLGGLTMGWSGGGSGGGSTTTGGGGGGGGQASQSGTQGMRFSDLIRQHLQRPN